MRRVLLLVVVLAVTAAILAVRVADPPFLGDGSSADRRTPAERERPRDREDRDRKPRRAERAVRCPSGVDDCRAVAGRILFVERVDPDGDGDLHVVLAAGGITGPGVTAVDVRPGLRPRRDPRVGERASAAGPVQRGSFRQRQIHALRFRVHR